MLIAAPKRKKSKMLNKLKYIYLLNKKINKNNIKKKFKNNNILNENITI